MSLNFHQISKRARGDRRLSAADSRSLTRFKMSSKTDLHYHRQQKITHAEIKRQEELHVLPHLLIHSLHLTGCKINTLCTARQASQVQTKSVIHLSEKLRTVQLICLKTYCNATRESPVLYMNQHALARQDLCNQLDRPEPSLIPCVKCEI